MSYACIFMVPALRAYIFTLITGKHRIPYPKVEAYSTPGSQNVAVSNTQVQTSSHHRGKTLDWGCIYSLDWTTRPTYMVLNMLW